MAEVVLDANVIVALLYADDSLHQRAVVACPGFAAIEDALPASRQLENANDSRQFRRLGLLTLKS